MSYNAYFITVIDLECITRTYAKASKKKYQQDSHTISCRSTKDEVALYPQQTGRAVG
jgi:hypothetical protein